MNDLLDLLKAQMGPQMMDQLTHQIGGNVRREQTAVATDGILNTLIGALAKNASSTEGARNLDHALQRDHDGSLLDNIGDFFQGNVREAQRRSANGAGILNHLLGNRQSGAIDMISRMSGLDQNKTGNLMMTLAPIVMQMLGRQKRQNNLDAGGITNLLTNSVQRERQNAGNPLIDMATRFLDADGDGSAIDDIAGNLLGNLFGGRQ